MCPPCHKLSRFASYIIYGSALVCSDGNDNIAYRQHVEFTDFPLDEITLYFANNVIYLPSEH